MPQADVESFRRYIEAINTHDVEAAVALTQMR